MLWPWAVVTYCNPDIEKFIRFAFHLDYNVGLHDANMMQSDREDQAQSERKSFF